MLFAPHARHDDDQAGHRADDNRVNERLEQGDDAFRNRFVRLRGCVRNRRGALTGFIREQPAPNTPHHGDEQSTNAGAGDACSGIECLAEDQTKRRQDVARIH
jgi:hypothetical protein